MKMQYILCKECDQDAHVMMICRGNMNVNLKSYQTPLLPP